ncbi:MAG: hypothetical protein IKP56_03425 [Bacilli bacterium]|nr:hypothetical protein [Bacilli bacterium]
MKKSKLSLLLLPLLLTSCVTDSGKEKSGFVSAESSEISLSSSFDFGSDPTSTYQRESADFILVNRFDYRVTRLRPNGDKGLWGPSIGLRFGDSWVDVEVVGQKDITAGVKGSSSAIIGHAYNDYNNDILLDGRKFPGVDGEWAMYAYIPEKACRNPGEAFIRLISHPKDNLDAINGYALVAVYPTGDPVDATSEEASIYHEEYESIAPGPVWLDWKTEPVGDGVSFPKVNGEYQDVDVNRVNAALDIMCENAKGHYFSKAS